MIFVLTCQAKFEYVQMIFREFLYSKQVYFYGIFFSLNAFWMEEKKIVFVSASIYVNNSFKMQFQADLNTN